MSRALVPGNKGLGLRSFRPPRKKSADLGSSRCEVDIKRVYDAVIRPGNLSNAGLILPTCRLFRLSLDTNLVQAEVQILSESPFLYCFLEVHIGGSDNTHVGAKDPVAAEAFELPLFDQTKQIALQFQRTLTDLVQEDSAAVGELE